MMLIWHMCGPQPEQDPFSLVLSKSFMLKPRARLEALGNAPKAQGFSFWNKAKSQFVLSTSTTTTTQYLHSVSPR